MSRPVIIYDGECAFCRRSVAWYQARDRGQRIEYLARQSPERITRYPQLDAVQYQGAMQCILPEGTVRSGADAAATTLTYLPQRRWRIVGALLHVWGVRHVAHLTYRWISKNRYRFACDTNRCPIK